MLEKVSSLVSAAQAEIRAKKNKLAIKLLSELMLKAETARNRGDEEGLKRALENQKRLEAMNVRDVTQFIEEK